MLNIMAATYECS